MPANPFEHFVSPIGEEIEKQFREAEKQLEQLVKKQQDEDTKSNTRPL